MIQTAVELLVLLTELTRPDHVVIGMTWNFDLGLLQVIPLLLTCPAAAAPAPPPLLWFDWILESR